MVVQLKANFKVKCKHGAFYTGGKVQISADGLHLLCQNKTSIEVIEIQTGQLYRTIGKDEEDTVSNFILSPDDKILVISGSRLVLRQFDWEKNILTRSWKAIHHAPVSCMTFDCTSTLLATGSADCTVKVWDVVQQYCTHNLRGHTGVISQMEFHPDIGKLQLLSASEDCKIRVWDLKSSACIATLDSHYSSITTLLFSPDHTTLYSGGRDNVITVWNLDGYKKEKSVPVFESIEGMVLIPSTDEYKQLGVVNKGDVYILSAGSQGSLKVWNVTANKCVHTMEMVHSKAESEETAESSLTSVLYNKTLDTIGVVTYDHNIIMYSRKDLSLFKQFVGYQDDVLDVVFVGAEERHLAVATNSPHIQVYDIDTWDCDLLQGHSDIVVSLDVSRDKQLLVSAAKDNCVFVWKMDSVTRKMSCVGRCEGHSDSVQSVAFSRLNSSFVVTGSQDQTVKLWDLPKQYSAGEVVSVTARRTEKAHDRDISCVVVAPNDKFIATGSQDKTTKLWGAETLSLIGVFRGHKRGIWNVQFSPVDQCLASASGDSTIKIWSLTDFTCVKTFEGHTSAVVNLVFLSSGMQLLSSGTDGMLKLWTIKTSECVKTFDEHTDKVWALTCNQSESVMVSGAEDSQIVLWSDVTIEEQEEARAKQEELILQVQELENLLHQKKYLKAISLAIKLDQPFRVLNIIKEVLKESGSADLESTLLKLEDYQLDTILRYAGSWNTNAKHCHAAQFVISVIFRSYSPEELFKLPNFRSSLEGLLPYTERHMQRMRRLEQQSTFVDYTWQSMRLVVGDGLSTAEEDVTEMDVDSPVKHRLMSTKVQEVRESSDESEDSAFSEHQSDSDSEPTVVRTKKIKLST